MGVVVIYSTCSFWPPTPSPTIISPVLFNPFLPIILKHLSNPEGRHWRAQVAISRWSCRGWGGGGGDASREEGLDGGNWGWASTPALSNHGQKYHHHWTHMRRGGGESPFTCILKSVGIPYKDSGLSNTSRSLLTADIIFEWFMRARYRYWL